MSLEVLDLFSAAAGGWSLGLHRAGFTTMAACEVVDWRRTLYSENNPGVMVYDDVRTLTAERLLRDHGRLPGIVVGSPPCQDISSANTKGKGVDGARSGLYFEAVRIIGECRPRWFALENSSNLRTRGADRIIEAFQAIGYTCWAFVVGADDVGANHERKRSWIIGCDLEQITAHAHGDGEHAQSEHGEMAVMSRLGTDSHATGQRYESGRSWRHGPHGNGATSVAACERNTPDPDQARQAHGCVEPGLRQTEIADDGRGAGRGVDGSGLGQMAICTPDCGSPVGSRADWSLNDLSRHIRLDDGLPAWVAGTRIAVGGPRGTSAASLIVEAFGDAVLPQIPEAIGRAILRTEAALTAIYGKDVA